jgi:hypothetical protein
VFSKPCVDCEAASQRTTDAVSKYGFSDLRGSMRIVVVQHARERDAMSHG